MSKSSKSNKNMKSKKMSTERVNDRRNAPEDWLGGLIHEVPGFRTAALHCGLKRKKTKPDIGLLYCEKPASGAAVFTTNLVRAAPVELSREALVTSKGLVRALIVNAGNANACTGVQGERDAKKMASLTARSLKCPVAQIQVCSTGIIGEHLPMKKIERGIGGAAKAVLKRVQTGDFARAILTTDLVTKTAATSFTCDDQTVHLAGTTKGSGMIAPRMATTLGFVVTDLNIEPAILQSVLREVADRTYNCITVDGDTSTNDTLLVLASGAAGNKRIRRASGKAYGAFKDALFNVCDRLARQVAADGEGATHTVTVYVGGTRTQAQAKQVARTIADSPLVKTAIAGHDPNWGRIIAAAGRSGVAFDPTRMSLTVCGHELYADGAPRSFNEKKVSKAMRKRDVSLVLMLGDGPGAAKFYTCDLTNDYVRINTAYHT